MAKQGIYEINSLTHHYYVAIFKNKKLYFMTGIDGNKVRWEKGKSPLDFMYHEATAVADGLVKQGYDAFVLQSLKAIQYSE